MAVYMKSGISRDTLGRAVRKAWIQWANDQPEPKPSWFVTYDDLPERDKEADRQIGEMLFTDGMDAGVDFVLDHLAKALKLDQYVNHDGSETWDGDVLATLWGVLYDANVLDPQDNSRMVLVKPLVWHEEIVDRGDGYSEPTGNWGALTPVGGYDIEMRDGSDSPYWVVLYNYNQIGDYESPDDAKTGAQGDFRKRVLKMLVLGDEE